MSHSDRSGLADVARRALGGPPKAEPGADAGPAAPQAPRLTYYGSIRQRNRTYLGP